MKVFFRKLFLLQLLVLFRASIVLDQGTPTERRLETITEQSLAAAMAEVKQTYSKNDIMGKFEIKKEQVAQSGKFELLFGSKKVSELTLSDGENQMANLHFTNLGISGLKRSSFDYFIYNFQNVNSAGGANKNRLSPLASELALALSGFKSQFKNSLESFDDFADLEKTSQYFGAKIQQLVGSQVAPLQSDQRPVVCKKQLKAKANEKDEVDEICVKSVFYSVNGFEDMIKMRLVKFQLKTLVKIETTNGSIEVVISPENSNNLQTFDASFADLLKNVSSISNDWQTIFTQAANEFVFQGCGKFAETSDNKASVEGTSLKGSVFVISEQSASNSRMLLRQNNLGESRKLELLTDKQCAFSKADIHVACEQLGDSHIYHFSYQNDIFEKYLYETTIEVTDKNDLYNNLKSIMKEITDNLKLLTVDVKMQTIALESIKIDALFEDSGAKSENTSVSLNHNSFLEFVQSICNRLRENLVICKKSTTGGTNSKAECSFKSRKIIDIGFDEGLSYIPFVEVNFISPSKINQVSSNNKMDSFQLKSKVSFLYVKMFATQLRDFLKNLEVN